jgi:hypothetical protein
MTPESVNVAELVTKKERILRFQQIPEIKNWLDGSDIKPTTRWNYSQRLYEFLDGQPPKQFLEKALKDPRGLSIEVKTKLAPVIKRSPSIAFHMRAAVKSLLEFYETGIHLNSKVKLRRSWKKPYLAWADAEKIIGKTREPYETVLRFMLWAGIGSDEFLEINGSRQIQANLAKQMADNARDYVIIDLEPRKQTLTRYFTAVPKRYVPKFPVINLDYKIRGGKPITRQNLEERFRKAATEVDLYEKGMGPHILRSVFTSQCAMLGVRESVCEFLKGHGGGDKYGYSREVLNEEYVVKELRKLWEPATVRKEEVEELRTKLARLEEKEEARKRPDSYMDQLMADQEFEQFVRKKILQLKLKQKT